MTPKREYTNIFFRQGKLNCGKGKITKNALQNGFYGTLANLLLWQKGVDDRNHRRWAKLASLMDSQLPR